MLAMIYSRNAICHTIFIAMFKCMHACIIMISGLAAIDADNYNKFATLIDNLKYYYYALIFLLRWVY